MIVRCNPPDYLEKEGEEFRKALKNDEVFARPPDQRIEILGPDLFLFDKEVVVKPGALLTCDRGIVSYQERAE